MKPINKILTVLALTAAIIMPVDTMAQGRPGGGGRQTSQGQQRSTGGSHRGGSSGSSSSSSSRGGAGMSQRSTSRTLNTNNRSTQRMETPRRDNRISSGSGVSTSRSQGNLNNRGVSTGTNRATLNAGARPTNNRVEGNINTRPNNNIVSRPAGNVGNRPNGNNRPEGNVGGRPNGQNRPNGNVGNRPNGGGNHGWNNGRPNHGGHGGGYRPSQPRPGGWNPVRQPHYNYRHAGYRPPRPGGGYWGAPGPNRYRLRYWAPPVPRYGFVRPGIPTLGTVLGLTFGSFIDAGINALFNAGYAVTGYLNNAIYLSNVRQLGYMWPEVQVVYNDGLMTGTQFYAWTQMPDMIRYNALYSQLCSIYGDPVSTTFNGGQQTSTWWAGGQTGYITLQYGYGPSATGLNSYYTTLTYNAY